MVVRFSVEGVWGWRPLVSGFSLQSSRTSSLFFLLGSAELGRGSGVGVSGCFLGMSFG